MSDQHIVLVDATGPKVRVDFDVANNTNTFTGGVYAPRFRSDLTTPASASAPGAVGTIVWDANYVYVCVGTNMWKRAALSSW
jgi:hypothetical protein